MLAAIVCAVLSQARGCDAIAQWVKSQGLAVWHLLGGTRHPPCSNCFRDLLAVLPPQVLEAVVQSWLGDAAVDAEPPVPAAVRLDGKTLRGTLAAHARTMHLLTAWDERQGGVLKQLPCESVGHESQTALSMIRDLVLRDRVLTADAAFCHQDVCQAVQDQAGDYLLTVKDNQPLLKAAIESEFSAPEGVFSPLCPA